jgi:hypothetical protein
MILVLENLFHVRQVNHSVDICAFVDFLDLQKLSVDVKSISERVNPLKENERKLQQSTSVDCIEGKAWFASPQK